MIVRKETDLALAVARAYRKTRAKFQDWARNKKYRQYVVPVATKPGVGFAIFYTPATFQPRLLLIGQNPAAFGVGGNLRDQPNGEMLSGTKPPLKNTYIEHKHRFAESLKHGFGAQYCSLLKTCVGMNVWHFQSPRDASSAPKDLLRFCEGITTSLVSAIQAQHILCLGKPAFNALREGERVPGTQKARVVSLGSSKLWYVPHPNARPPSDFVEDLPVVLAAIERELSGIGAMRQRANRRYRQLRKSRQNRR